MAIAVTCRHGANCPKCLRRITKHTSSVRKTPQHKFHDNGIQIQTLVHAKQEHGDPLPSRHDSPLYALPPEVLGRIARHLPYEALLVLGGLSRTLRRRVDPQVAAEESKIGLVLRAEKDAAHNFRRHRERLGCFACYRVLAVGEFAAEQLARDPYSRRTGGATFLRRYCVPCGLRRGWHRPGEVIERRDSSTWWVCGCRQARDKATTSACRRCGSEYSCSLESAYIAVIGR